MTALRRALALLPLGALATVVTAAPAGAAVLNTDACVRYVGGKDQPPMAIGGGGFTPNGVITLATKTKTTPRPARLTSSPLQPTGLFLKTTRPPQFSSPRRNLEAFTLIGVDRTNPQAPITATTPFRMVRFGLTSKPAPKRPTSRITYTARGFTTGRRVYIHFRFGGVTRRTVSLGVAKGPCGMVSRRMRALPTRARYGEWTSYTNQSGTSSRALPSWKDTFTIFRRPS
ncbi:MAG TPA: hypothetical protein VEX67_14320 [Solirubrobacteraceae bacterium]|nr:hypothetical protein [Solirubrobacteraceae bacterium]